MSKMGRYVYDLQMAEEAELYGYSDRKGCTDAEANEDTGVAIGGNGGRGFVRGANQLGRPDRGESLETADISLATGPIPYEVLRRS